MNIEEIFKQKICENRNIFTEKELEIIFNNITPFAKFYMISYFESKQKEGK